MSVKICPLLQPETLLMIQNKLTIQDAGGVNDSFMTERNLSKHFNDLAYCNTLQ